MRRSVACGFLLLLFSPLLSQAQDNPRPLPLTESVTVGSVSANPLSLGLKDVVDRAVKNNLATLLASEDERVATAQRLKDLGELYPRIEAYAASEQRQVNIAAFGFGGFPGVRQVIGPFSLLDFRASLTHPIIDLERRHNLRESTESQRASAFTSANVRELVVLTAIDIYFRVVSSQSRVTAVEAQLSRAQALHERAIDLKDAGVVAGIDVLRAEVERRTLEQRLIQARNLVEKEKLELARATGLPLGQRFVLSDKLPPEGQTAPALDQLIEQAGMVRPDAKAADARIRAAEESVKATKARNLPTLNVTGDYGAIGRTPGNSHGTYSLRVEVRVPLFDKTIDADLLEEEASVRQRRAERDSLRGRIEMEVRSALLDLQSSEEQLRVARQSLDLARQQLDQAQDRFAAGVVNNLEVVQAQEAVSLAEEGVIQGLYGYNIARALLLRAIGSVEQSISDFFSGSSIQ